MSQNYAKQQAMDRGGQVFQEFTMPFKALAQNERNNLTVSSVFTLHDNCTVVEVGAVGAPAAIRWIPATETAAVTPFASVITLIGSENFDAMVSKDTVRHFVVPVETQGISSIVGMGVQAGTYRRLAIISAAAVSSVLLSQY